MFSAVNIQYRLPLQHHEKCARHTILQCSEYIIIGSKFSALQCLQNDPWLTKVNEGAPQPPVTPFEEAAVYIETKPEGYILVQPAGLEALLGNILKEVQRAPAGSLAFKGVFQHITPFSNGTLNIDNGGDQRQQVVFRFKKQPNKRLKLETALWNLKVHLKSMLPEGYTIYEASIMYNEKPQDARLRGTQMPHTDGSVSRAKGYVMLAPLGANACTLYAAPGSCCLLEKLQKLVNKQEQWAVAEKMLAEEVPSKPYTAISIPAGHVILMNDHTVHFGAAGQEGEAGWRVHLYVRANGTPGEDNTTYPVWNLEWRSPAMGTAYGVTV